MEDELLLHSTTNEEKLAIIQSFAYNEFSKKNYELCKQKYSEAISIEKQNFIWYYNRALIFAKCSKYEEALSDLNRIFNLESSHSPSWYLKGLVLEKLLKIPEAIFCFQQALDFNINSSKYMDKVQYYLVEECQKYAKKKNIMPSSASIIFLTLSMSAISKENPDNYEKAILKYQKALSIFLGLLKLRNQGDIISKEYITSLIFLGEIVMPIGNQRLAISCFLVTLCISIALSQQSQVSEDKIIYDKYAKKAKANLAELYESRGLISQSKRLIQEVIASDDKQTESFALHIIKLAKVVVAEGNYEESIKLFSEAEELGKKNSWNNIILLCQGCLGNIYSLLGIEEEAYARQSNAVQKCREMRDYARLPTAIYNLSLTCLRLEKYDEIFKLIEESFSINESVENQLKFYLIKGMVYQKQCFEALRHSHSKDAPIVQEYFHKGTNELKEGFELACKEVNLPKILMLGNRLSFLYCELEHNSEALEVIRKITQITDVNAFDDKISLADMNMINGGIMFNLKNWNESLMAYQKSFTLLLNIRETIRKDEQLIMWSNRDSFDICCSYLQYLFAKLGKPIEALKISDSARSKSLLNQISKRLNITEIPQIDLEQLAGNDSLSNTIIIVFSEVFGKHCMYWVIIPSLKNKLGEDYIKFGKITLKKDGEQNNSDLDLEEVPRTFELSEYSFESKENFQYVWNSVAKHLNYNLQNNEVRNLIIIPDKKFFKIPFVAIKLESGMPLIKEFQISLVPSLSILKLCSGISKCPTKNERYNTQVIDHLQKVCF